MTADAPDNDPLDLLLRQAMTARAEEHAGMDLAAAALTRVRARDAQAAALARLGRWIGVSVVAAALLVAVSVTYILRTMPAAETSTQSTVQSTESTNGADAQTASVAFLGAAVAGLALLAVMSSDRRAPRLVPTI